jgi:hypothetical protein
VGQRGAFPVLKMTWLASEVLKRGASGPNRVAIRSGRQPKNERRADRSISFGE